MTCGSHGALGPWPAHRAIRPLILVTAAVALLAAPLSGQQGPAPSGAGSQSAEGAPQPSQGAAQAAQGRSSQLDRVFQGLAYRQVAVATGVSGGIDPVASAPGAAPEAVLSASPHEAGVWYRADRRVLRSEDGGATWTPISPELDTEGGPEGLTAIAESPVEPGLIWVGGADGRVHVTRDAGASWQAVTLPPPAGAGRVRAVEPSSHRGGTTYVVIDGRAEGDLRPLAFRTEDYGTGWTLLTAERSGVPEDHTITVLREDPDEARLLFTGTPHGVYVSFDRGGSWDLFQFGLPDVFVEDLRIVGRDLVVETAGSGYWLMDEIGPLRQVMEGLTAGEPYLFEPSPTYLDRLSEADAADVARGAIFDYLLPSNVRSVRLEVLHAEGEVLATFSGASAPRGSPGAPAAGVPAVPGVPGGQGAAAAPAGQGVAGSGSVPNAGRVPGTRAGVHRIVWDLAFDDPANGGSLTRATPGTYRLRLIVDGLVRERPFEIVETAGTR